MIKGFNQLIHYGFWYVAGRWNTRRCYC